MSSAAQIEANRRNAQHCAGPQTEAGKEASKMNALKHGLASAQVVLPHEDQAAFEDLKATLIAEHRPAGRTEQLLVAQLAESWWRALRARRVENLYLNLLADRVPGDGDGPIAIAVIEENDNAFAKIQRYVNAADRAFKSALRLLQETQRIRRAEEQQEKVNDILRARAVAKNGFVSQPLQAAQKTPSPPAAAISPTDPHDASRLKNPPLSPPEAILNSPRKAAA